MRLRHFNFFLLTLFFMSTAGGQQYNRDSVSHVIDQIRQLPVDTGHIRKLRELAYDIGESDSSLSKKLLFEALEKSITIKDNDAIANTYRILGLWYSGVDDKDKAQNYYRASLLAAKRTNHLYLIAGAYFNIGNIKYWKGEYDSCIDYWLQTQKIFEDPKIFEDKALTNRILDKKKSDLYSNMSSVFNTLKNLPKADEYIDKALAIAESYKANAVIAIYSQQKADNYKEGGNIEKALQTRLKYINELEKAGVSKTLLQGYYQNIAQEYFELGKIDSSKAFAQKSLQTAGELEVPNAVANASLLMGRVAMKENQLAVAEEYLKKAGPYYRQSEDPEEKRNYYFVMHQLMFASGKFKEAYQFFERYQALNDTILNSERTKQFSEREARYQSEKKDAQIKLQGVSLKQRTTLSFLMAGTVMALLIIGFLSFRNYKHHRTLQQKRIAELETEKQLAATEAVIKGEEQERARLAKDLHDGLGGMLSGIKYSLNTMKGNLIMTPENAQAFERSIDMLDSSIQEMRRVAHNMMPEALVKFGLHSALRDFCHDITLSGALNVNYQSIGMENTTVDQTTSITIYRIVQELINNTIKHGAAKTAIVQVSKTDKILTVTVEDDGIGFDTSILRRPKGIGWLNIQSRVEFLKGKMDVQSEPGKGTSVHIELNA